MSRRALLCAAAAVLVVCAGVVAAFATRSDGSTPVTPLPAPAKAVLVYSRPSTPPPGSRSPEIIYRSRPDGSARVRLTTGNYPLVSPDGRWIAFWRQIGDSGKLFVMRTAGGSPRAIDVDDNDVPVAWSWDSQMLAVESEAQVSIVTLHTGHVRTLHVPDGSGGYSFSPDGTELVFAHSTGRGINLMRLDLPDGDVQPLTTDGRSSEPLWGPRGIAFERYAGAVGLGGDVWLMNGDGSHARQLTHTRASIAPAVWSADGSRMLAAYPPTHNGKLYAVNVETGAARDLTGWVGDLNAEGLSRDGKTVLASIGCGGGATLYGVVETIPFGGGRPTVIVSGPCAATWTK